MTLLVQPVIAVMMITLTWGIAGVSLWALTKGRIHPAIVIVAAFVYGGIFLSGIIV